MTIGGIFLSETMGTATLSLLGGGVVANTLLPKTKGKDGGWILISWGWGLAIFVGVLIAIRSGAHINPAVTLGFVAAGENEFVEGVPITTQSTLVYIGAQMFGAFLGAVLVWLCYKKHYDLECSPSLKLATFSTGPEIRSYGWNFLTETIGAFILVFPVIAVGKTVCAPEANPVNLGWLGALGAALLVAAIVMSLGGATGSAVNPARDLGPRIAHAILPFKGKGSSDWAYAWIPVVGPSVGGILAGVVCRLMYG